MSFKQKMMNDYIFPAQNGGEHIARAIGDIIDTNERTNTCVVRYRDKKNQSIVKYDVPVRLSSVSIIDWFPKKGDRVIIEANNISPVIIGEYEMNSKTTNRSVTTLDSDIYSDNMSCETNGGHIF